MNNSFKKVEDGAEGYMASLSVKAYKDFNFHINSHSPDAFIKCLVKIGFLEVVE